MTEEILQKLIEWIETASPLLWETLVRQVYSDAFIYVALCIMWITIGTTLFLVGKRERSRFFQRGAEGDYHVAGDDYYIGILFLSGVAFAAFFVFAVLAGQRLYNPSFYAIRLLLETIK